MSTTSSLASYKEPGQRLGLRCGHVRGGHARHRRASSRSSRASPPSPRTRSSSRGRVRLQVRRHDLGLDPPDPRDHRHGHRPRAARRPDLGADRRHHRWPSSGPWPTSPSCRTTRCGRCSSSRFYVLVMWALTTQLGEAESASGPVRRTTSITRGSPAAGEAGALSRAPTFPRGRRRWGLVSDVVCKPGFGGSRPDGLEPRRWARDQRRGRHGDDRGAQTGRRAAATGRAPPASTRDLQAPPAPYPGCRGCTCRVRGSGSVWTWRRRAP